MDAGLRDAVRRLSDARHGRVHRRRHVHRQPDDSVSARLIKCAQLTARARLTACARVCAALLAVTWFDRRWKGDDPEVAEQEIA